MDMLGNNLRVLIVESEPLLAEALAMGVPSSEPPTRGNLPRAL